MEYTVAEAFSEDSRTAICELINEVERHILLGFEPIGGISVTIVPVDRAIHTGENGFLVTQALIKR